MKYYLIKAVSGSIELWKVIRDDYVGGGGMFVVLAYKEPEVWQRISEYFFPCPDLKTYISRCKSWTLVEESSNLQRLLDIKAQEELRYKTMKELIA